MDTLISDPDTMVNVDLKQWTVMAFSFQIINGLQSLIYGVCLSVYFYHYHKAITNFNKVALIVFGMGLFLRTALYLSIYELYSPIRTDQIERVDVCMSADKMKRLSYWALSTSLLSFILYQFFALVIYRVMLIHIALKVESIEELDQNTKKTKQNFSIFIVIYNLLFLIREGLSTIGFQKAAALYSNSTMIIVVFALTLLNFLLNLGMIVYFIKVSSYFGKMLDLDKNKKCLLQAIIILLPISLLLQVI
jgi:hypothetical protein